MLIDAHRQRLTRHAVEQAEDVVVGAAAKVLRHGALALGQVGLVEHVAVLRRRVGRDDAQPVPVVQAGLLQFRDRLEFQRVIQDPDFLGAEPRNSEHFLHAVRNLLLQFFEIIETALRHERRDGNKHADQAKKDGELSEDNNKLLHEKILEALKKAEGRLDEVLKKKTAEILEE